MQRIASLIAAMIAGLLAVSGLTGCTPFEESPYSRAGTWAPTGVNDANLRAMVADPADLALGQGSEHDLGAEAAPPVERLLTGHRPPLPTESASGIGSNTQTQATPQAPPNVGQ